MSRAWPGLSAADGSAAETHLVGALQGLDRLAALANHAADHALGALHDPRDAGPELHLRENVVSVAPQCWYILTCLFDLSTALW